MSIYEISTVSTKTIDIIIDFLIPYEHLCVSLMARLLDSKKKWIKKREQIIYVVKEKYLPLSKNSIQGVFLITNTGTLLHHIKKCPIQEILKEVLQKVTLYSLAGTHDSSILFEDILLQKPQTSFDYYLMQNVKTKGMYQSQKKKLPVGFSLCKCTLADAENLFNLQMNYQLEEVLPPGKTISTTLCKKIMQERLLNHDVYGIKDIKKNIFVSMAGTNAIGLHCVQLGGVYTNTDYRCRGFAQFLVDFLVENTPKKVVLFVKKENAPALKAYRKTHFEIVDSYRICYM